MLIFFALRGNDEILVHQAMSFLGRIWLAGAGVFLWLWPTIVSLNLAPLSVACGIASALVLFLVMLTKPKGLSIAHRFIGSIVVGLVITLSAYIRMGKL